MSAEPSHPQTLKETQETPMFYPREIRNILQDHFCPVYSPLQFHKYLIFLWQLSGEAAGAPIVTVCGQFYGQSSVYQE